MSRVAQKGDTRVRDAKAFARVLKQAVLPSAEIRFGHFALRGRAGVADRIQYNLAGLDMLRGAHEYTFAIRDGDLQVSAQLYENISAHFRLFCYTRLGSVQGMTFSIT